MKTALVDCGSKRVGQLRDIVANTGASVSTVMMEHANGFDFSQFHAVVISGGPHLFTGTEGHELVDKFRFMDSLDQPLLGICLGHQAVGIHFGANVFRGEERRGQEIIHRLHDHPLLAGMGMDFKLCADHCEGINCPDSFRSIARSDYYVNEIIVNDTLRIYGVQSHPETSGQAGLKLIKNFLELASKTP